MNWIKCEPRTSHHELASSLRNDMRFVSQLDFVCSAKFNERLLVVPFCVSAGIRWLN